jgi:RND family efflux transporter MFP subunit
MRKWIVLLAAVVVCSCGEKKKDMAKAPVRVKTEVLAAGAANGRQTYVGIVEANEGTAVGFTSMGVIRQMLVSEGQAVSRGQLLAVIDDTQARNVLAGAEAGMAQANDALQRYGQLHDSGSLPEVQWVEILSKVEQAKAQLAVARKNVADCRLTAPVSGIIGKRMFGVGETAMPARAVLTILDISTVKVKVSVPEGEMAAIRPDTKSTVRVEAVNRSYEGGHIETGVQADAMTHTYDIRISVPNGDRSLLPGMVASVSIDRDAAALDHILSLPIGSVQRRPDGSLFVWTIDEGNKAHRTPVTIGSTLGNRVVLVSGVEGGQRVVTEGYQKLSEGSAVVY